MSGSAILRSAGNAGTRIEAADTAVRIVPQAHTISKGKLTWSEFELRQDNVRAEQAFYPLTEMDELDVVQGELVFSYVKPYLFRDYNPNPSDVQTHIFSSVNGLNPDNPDHAIRCVGMAANTLKMRKCKDGNEHEQTFSGLSTGTVTGGPVTVTVFGTQFVDAGVSLCWRWPEYIMLDKTRVPLVFLSSRPRKFVPGIYPYKVEATRALFQTLATEFEQAVELVMGINAADLIRDKENAAQMMDRRGKRIPDDFKEQILDKVSVDSYSFFPRKGPAVLCPVRKFVNRLIYEIAGEQSGVTPSDFSLLELDPNDSTVQTFQRYARKRAREFNITPRPTKDRWFKALNHMIEGVEYCSEQEKLEKQHIIGDSIQAGGPGTRVEILMSPYKH